MSLRDPIALSDRQMQMLRDAAATLPESSRHDFAYDVAKRLGGGAVGDGALDIAINAALCRCTTTKVFMLDAETCGTSRPKRASRDAQNGR